MRSRIWAWIVTSSAVVGSSAISSFGSQASAMAIITRWRMPPENWCGIVVEAARGRGCRPAPAARWRACGACVLELEVYLERLGELPIDGEHRVQRRHRVLEDHGDPVAADLAHLVFAELRRSSPSKGSRPTDAPGGLGMSRMRESALTLLPQPDSPTRPSASPLAHRVGDAVHGVDGAVARPERDAQVADREQRKLLRRRLPDHRRSFGSSASRIPSPRRLKPSTETTMKTPGNTASHGAWFR